MENNLNSKTGRARVLVITSGKGGVGKTTTVSHVGCNLARVGKKVLIIDTDTGLCNLDAVVGMEGEIQYALADVLTGRCQPAQAILKTKICDNLYLLAADRQDYDADDADKKFRTMLAVLRSEFDYILVDCPAGVGAGFQMATAGADAAIVVVNPEISSIRDADRTIAKLELKQISDISIVITKSRQEMIDQGLMLSRDDVVDILGVNCIGEVPDDRDVIIANNTGAPLEYNDGIAGIAYDNICRRIMGEDVPFLDLSTPKSIFQKWSKKLRLNKLMQQRAALF